MYKILRSQRRMMWKYNFFKFFHSTFDVRIESSFLRAIWTRPIVRFNIWNFQTKLTIEGKKTRFVLYKSLAWRTNHVFFILITIHPTPFPFSAFRVNCQFVEILHFHSSCNVSKFLHLTFPMLNRHYRFLDLKKLDNAIYKKQDLMTFFQELWYFLWL